MIAGQPPDDPAIIDGAEVISYGALEHASRRVAAGLAALGIGMGDRVALWLPNVPAWLVLFLACARLGAIAVSINTRFRGVEVADIVARSRARALVLWPDFKDIDFLGILGEIEPPALARVETLIAYDPSGAGAAAGKNAAAHPALAGSRWTIVAYQALEAAEPDRADDATPDAGCAVFTTSGTTKAPKLVLHCQRAVVAQARIVAEGCGFTAPEAKSLMALPLCGVFGFGLAMATLAAGKPIVLMTVYDPARAARLVQQHGITSMYGSDDLFHSMLNAAPEAKPFPSLTLCGYAAFNAALTTIVSEGDKRGVACVGVYGSSELQPLVTCQRRDAPAAERAQGGGYPVGGAAAFRVRDPETGELLANGQPGELEVQGPSLFVGYLGDEEATREAMTDDGFFRTGDLGMVQGDGRVVFLSRIGDVLRLGGFLTSPTEIEAHIEDHPSVAECKVVGIPTETGNRAVAFVIPATGAALDEAALARHCHAGIAKYKVPTRYFAIDAFPVSMSPNGLKIQRGKLRDMALARIGGAGSDPGRPARAGTSESKGERA
jgi:fatty-acyl-CoA synthase